MSWHWPIETELTMFNFNNSFYKPLWLRVGIVVACMGWAALEFSLGNLLWGGVFAAIGASAFYGLFITFDPPEKQEGNSNDE